MRIAFVSPYQGPTLLKRRPVVANLSLGARAKIELIADLLQGSSHSVEILSQGEVIERQFKIFPAFHESEQFNSEIPVYYSSAFPVRFLNGVSSNWSTLALFKARNKVAPFDLMIIYNLKTPQVACADYAIRKLGIPVVLEYEDDYFRNIFPQNDGKTSGLRQLQGTSRDVGVRHLLESLSGCLAGSVDLLSQVGEGIPRLLLPGVVGASAPKGPGGAVVQKENWVVFSGTHSSYQGLEQLVNAWKIVDLPNWQLHIAGKGALTSRLQELAQGNPTIVFRGVLNRKENIDFLSRGKLTVVAYEVSSTIGFSFKTLECLGLGMHVITTPLTALETLEPELKAGLTYIPDNKPETIAASLKKVIGERIYERTVQEATIRKYGPAAISRSLEEFLTQVRMHGGGIGGR